MKTIQTIHYHLPQLKIEEVFAPSICKIITADRFFATIAIGRIHDDVANHNLIYVRGISICSPNEQFTKLDGTHRAIGRMIKAACHCGNIEKFQSTPFRIDKKNKITRTDYTNICITATDLIQLSSFNCDFKIDIGTKRQAYSIMLPDVITHKSQFDVTPTSYEELHFAIADRIYSKRKSDTDSNIGFTRIIEF